MSTYKYIDRICGAVLILVLLLTFVLTGIKKTDPISTRTEMGYEAKLFDTSSVHTINIVMDDWDGFLETCENEEYEACSVIIDDEAYKNVGIRAKGNTSLSSVSTYGNDRYSFKIEFDCYEDGKTYYGLDKLNLNNMIQDNTYMKDYLTYQMMGYYGVDSPLCSYVYITVNGEEWGLYMAAEGVDNSFLERNYGSDYGKLYKPDSTRMGGENMQSNDVSLIYTDDNYKSYSNIFDNAKTELTDADKTRLMASLKNLKEGKDIKGTVNVEEVMRYFVVHNFVCNFDSYTGSIIHNYYLYETDGMLSMIPWDYNLAFGGFESRTDAESLVNYPIDSPVSGGTIESRPMLAWIFESEEYTQMYHEYFGQFITECIDSGYVTGMIDSVTEMLSPYVEKDPTRFCTFEEFKEGSAELKEFCLLRAESVSGQLEGAIPSTSDGQEQNGSSLVKAPDLSISAMGSMGSHKGNGMGVQNSKDQSGKAQKNNSVPAFAPMPGNRPSETKVSVRGDVWMPLGISAVILFLGLFIVSGFQRRKRLLCNNINS